MSIRWAEGTRPAVDPLLYTAEETAGMLRIGRRRVFEMIRTGELKSVKIGSSRRVTREAIEEFVRSLRASA